MTIISKYKRSAYTTTGKILTICFVVLSTAFDMSAHCGKILVTADSLPADVVEFIGKRTINRLTVSDSIRVGYIVDINPNCHLYSLDDCAMLANYFISHQDEQYDEGIYKKLYLQICSDPSVLQRLIYLMDGEDDDYNIMMNNLICGLYHTYRLKHGEGVSIYEFEDEHGFLLDLLEPKSIYKKIEYDENGICEMVVPVVALNGFGKSVLVDGIEEEKIVALFGDSLNTSITILFCGKAYYIPISKNIPLLEYADGVYREIFSDGDKAYATIRFYSPDKYNLVADGYGHPFGAIVNLEK